MSCSLKKVFHTNRRKPEYLTLPVCSQAVWRSLSVLHVVLKDHCRHVKQITEPPGPPSVCHKNNYLCPVVESTCTFTQVLYLKVHYATFLRAVNKQKNGVLDTETVVCRS